MLEMIDLLSIVSIAIRLALQFFLFLFLSSVLGIFLKELREVKRKSAALQMQQFVGEEKNDLLDYLRSLQPEQVLPFVKILHLCSIRTTFLRSRLLCENIFYFHFLESVVVSLVNK
jgi:hypothetical protein